MKKFADAFCGLKAGLSHKAIAIQFILGIFAIIGGLIIKLDYYEWLAFVICISVVIALEIANTCIEYLCNFIKPEFDLKIKTIKDMSAAFVLVASIGSLVITILVVLRRIL